MPAKRLSCNGEKNREIYAEKSSLREEGQPRVNLSNRGEKDPAETKKTEKIPGDELEKALPGISEFRRTLVYLYNFYIKIERLAGKWMVEVHDDHILFDFNDLYG